MDIIGLLKELCGVPAPSGGEGALLAVLSKYMDGLAGPLPQDRLGNIHALRSCERPGAPTLLLDAHIDQVSMITVGVTEEGFLRFHAQGLDPRILPAREVIVLAGRSLRGIVASMPPHILSADEAEKVQPASELAIDIGLSALRARDLVPAGTRVVFEQDFRELAGGFVSSGALDNRAGAAALILTLRLLAGRELACNIAVMFSAQEEAGCLGAAAGAYNTAPEMCLVLDATHAKSPDTKELESFEAGGGPMIGVGPNLAQGMTDGLKKTAKKMGIKHGLEIMEGNTGTNAWPIQISRGGVATALLSIPVRYMHTPIETMCLADLEATARLAAEFIVGIGRGAAL